MSTDETQGQSTIEVAYDLRVWATFAVTGLTAEEEEILQGEDAEAITLAQTMHDAGRLTLLDEHNEDTPDLFNVETSNIIDVTRVEPKTHVLIDEQKRVEIHPEVVEQELDGKLVYLPFLEVDAILDAWVSLAPGRRSYRYGGDESSTEPSTVIIAEALSAGPGMPTLSLSDVEPWWTEGGGARNGYILEHLSAALGEGALQWGAAIGEEELT